MYNTNKPPKLSTFTKYVKKKKNEEILQIMLKYVFITNYVKTCKIKYVLFYWKSCEI